MLSRVPVPPENIHRVRGELADAQQAAGDYEQELIRAFHLNLGQVPEFDCILLGMGPDGHIASLFPGTKALREKKRLVAANWVEKFMHSRITMTFPVFNNAHRIIFLVTGGNKAEILREVLEGDEPIDPLPAQMVRPNNGTVIWLADRVAANLLSMTDYATESGE
jgi:6-phosphogluconolactonase